MILVKNTYGTSVAFCTKMFGKLPKDEFSGSALQRKKQKPKTPEERKEENVKKEFLNIFKREQY